jgi:alpha/beta hydrolase fold
MMTTHAWLNIAEKLEPSISQLNTSLEGDKQFLAFSTSKAVRPVKFGWKAAGSDIAVLCSVAEGKAEVSTGPPGNAAFILCALPEQWQEFYQPMPKAPFQSFWGMYGQNIHQEGVEVLGDHDLFINYAPIWRRILELSHTALCGPIKEEVQEKTQKDVIVGKYVYITSPGWGEGKLFYEQSGEEDKPDILFLHTAGSDGRQYHGVMNDSRMLSRCRMTVIDLPGHGRSFPSENQIPGQHANSEDSYVGCIRAVIEALGLKKPIVCGASMAGHVCLAVATRAAEVGAGGVIPCQG